MKTLHWDPSLSVQVQEIDEDHQKLVNLFNLLIEAVEQNDAPAYIEALLQELISCTVWHFRHEERLMLKYGYPDIAAHTREHQELAKSVEQLLNQSLNGEKIAFLEQWLTGHILGADMAMGVYLGEQI